MKKEGFLSRFGKPRSGGRAKSGFPFRKAAIWIVAVAAGLVILLTAAAHTIVSSRLLRSWVNTDPEELLLEYDSASAWIPGVVRLRGLRMRGSDSNVQWAFRFDEARVSFSFFDLARKRFHATRVRGSGLTYRLRLKVDPKDASPAHLAAIPAIEGFADPPLAAPEEKEKKRSEALAKEHDPWRIHIANISSDISELWIDIYRYRGKARLYGGFFLYPRHQAHVFPASVQFLGGDLTLGKDTMAVGAEGRADCTIEPFDPRKVHGDEVWPSISGEFGLRGRLPSLRFVNYFLRHSRQPRLSGGAGTLRTNMKIERGIGRGAINFSAAGVEARYADATLAGRAAGRMTLARWEFERGLFDLSGSRLELRDISSQGAGPDSPAWWGTFDLTSASLRSRPSGLLAARFAAHCRDARPLYTLFETGLPGWARGLLKLEGVTATGRVALGKDLVDLKSLEAKGGAFHILGEFRRKGESKRGAFLIETGLLAVGVEIRDTGSKVKLLKPREWFREETGAAGAAAD